MVKNIQLRVSLKEEGKFGLKGKTAKYLGVSEKEIQIKVLRKEVNLSIKQNNDIKKKSTEKNQ